MSSVPMTSSSLSTGLGVIGCKAKPNHIEPSSDEACTPPRSSLPAGKTNNANSSIGFVNGTSEVNNPKGEPLPLHRIRTVREQQGVSVRSMSRRLGVDVRTYRRLEDPTYDLTMSELHAIQQALDVPLSDLLEDRQSLSRPVEERAKMVKTMKTAVAIREAKSTPRVQRLATMLCEQLVELMPELSEVSGWPQFGARRGQSALGKALRQPIDTSQISMSD